MPKPFMPFLIPPVLIYKEQMLQAWNWFLQEINPRPTESDTFCLFDQKCWGQMSNATPLRPVAPFTTQLAVLYLISQLGDFDTVFRLTNENLSDDLILHMGKLDSRIRELINNQTRFRAALSEHLAFWVYLAVASKFGEHIQVARSLPNFKPEIQGPDGVSIVIDNKEETNGKVEIHSIKNSTTDPARYISTSKLKKRGYASSYEKILDEFWYISHEGEGLIPLDRLLDQICSKLDFSPQQTIRMALLFDCTYNATVVANESYANIQLFQGYEHVVPDITRRVATYIGASDWKQFAEQTRQQVICVLTQAGAW